MFKRFFFVFSRCCCCAICILLVLVFLTNNRWIQAKTRAYKKRERKKSQPKKITNGNTRNDYALVCVIFKRIFFFFWFEFCKRLGFFFSLFGFVALLLFCCFFFFQFSSVLKIIQFIELIKWINSSKPIWFWNEMIILFFFHICFFLSFLSFSRFFCCQILTNQTEQNEERWEKIWLFFALRKKKWFVAMRNKKKTNLWMLKKNQYQTELSSLLSVHVSEIYCTQLPSTMNSNDFVSMFF